jgi:hypothetical protein
LRKQKWWYSVGLGLAIWGLSLIWPAFNGVLASPLVLGLVIGLWVAMLVYQIDRHQDQAKPVPRASANCPPLSHALPTHPLRPVSHREHSRPTRPISPTSRL